MSDTDRQKLTDELAALVAARAWFRHVGDTGCRGDVWASLRAGMIAEEMKPTPLRWEDGGYGACVIGSVAVVNDRGWFIGEPSGWDLACGLQTGARGRACAVRALVRHGVITQAEADGIAGP